MICSFVSVIFVLGYKHVCVYLHDGKHDIFCRYNSVQILRLLTAQFVVLYYFMS